MQSLIAYTDRLWKSLKRPPRALRRTPREIRGRLAPWIATLARYQGISYVVAVAKHSSLSLVFEASSLDLFKPAMVAAFGAAFADVGIATQSLSEETADIESAVFTCLRDPVVRSELEFVEAICGTEFSYFPDNLRRVQLNLNNLPRQSQTAGVPRQAAPLLFADLESSPFF
jgi:hypothetical protein